MYNEGISKTGDVLDLAIQKGIIEKAGAFLKYKGETIAQGREAAKALFKSNPELLAEIDQKVREVAHLTGGADEIAPEADPEDPVAE